MTKTNFDESDQEYAVGCFEHWNIRVLNLFRISCFKIRIFFAHASMRWFAPVSGNQRVGHDQIN